MSPFLDTAISPWHQPSLTARAGVPLTDAEWVSTLSYFPKLYGFRPQCLKTDEPTVRYNCIAWSLGITHQWIDPPNPQSAFEAFYLTRGFQPSSLIGATIDGYSRWGVMSHASRKDGTIWSSKRGANMRMTHPRFKLQGRLYGYVEIFFAPIPIVPPPPPATEFNISEANSNIVKAKVTSLAKRSAEEFPILTDTFDQNWLAWQNSWDDSNRNEAQSSDEFAQGPAWDNLVSMGTSILPQVVEKLQSDANIFACQLYNKLQTDPTKKVDPSDMSWYYILNNQAKAIQQLYGRQIARFEGLAADWAAIQQLNITSRDSHSFTSGIAYDAIREMGRPALPLIMDQYAQQQDGWWWHELLYEIEHGERSDARVFDKVDLYEFWSKWFQRPVGTA